MRIDVHHYLHIEGALELPAALERIQAGVALLQERMIGMAADFDRLVNEVEENNSVIQSAVVLLNSLRDEIRALADRPDADAINALADKVDAQTNLIANAMVANTPVEDEEPALPTEPTP